MIFLYQNTHRCIYPLYSLPMPIGIKYRFYPFSIHAQSQLSHAIITLFWYCCSFKKWLMNVRYFVYSKQLNSWEGNTERKGPSVYREDSRWGWPASETAKMLGMLGKRSSLSINPSSDVRSRSASPLYTLRIYGYTQPLGCAALEFE